MSVPDSMSIVSIALRQCVVLTILVAGNVSQADAQDIALLHANDLRHFRGYQQEKIDSGWSVQDQTLHLDGNAKMESIITKQTYQDFDLRFDWKISTGGNSGVIYRVGLGEAKPYITGIEFQVLDDAKYNDGKAAKNSAGSIYGLYTPEKYERRPAGQWNQARIVVKDSTIQHYLNGSLVAEADMDSEDWKTRIDASKFKSWTKFASLKSGHIAFQSHESEVWYRNIKIKNLDSAETTASKPHGSTKK